MKQNTLCIILFQRIGVSDSEMKRPHYLTATIARVELNHVGMAAREQVCDARDWIGLLLLPQLLVARTSQG